MNSGRMQSPMDNFDRNGLWESLLQHEITFKGPHCRCGCDISEIEHDAKMFGYGYLRPVFKEGSWISYGTVGWRPKVTLEQREELFNAAPRVRSEEPLPELTSEDLNESHIAIVCDGCEMRPIQGPRFHCLSCSNLDLCLNCFQTTPHSHTFALLKKSVW